MTIKTSKAQKCFLIILGVIATIIILEIALRIAGKVLLQKQENRNKVELIQTSPGAYRILCIGESTTMFGGENSYPRQLERFLNKKTKSNAFHVINKGVPGTNSAMILSNIREYIDVYKPNAVIAMMGINDGTNEDGSTIIYEDNFKVKALLFLNDFRAYKLFKLIKTHLRHKIREMTGRMRGEDYLIEQDLKKAIRKYPKDQWSYNSLMEFYLKSGRYEDAENVFRKAIRRRPTKEWPYAGLAACFKKQQKFPKAEKVYADAIQRNPSKTFGYKGLADLYIEQGKFAEAEEVLNTAITQYPENPEFYSLLGVCYCGSDNYQKAEETFNTAIKLGPGIYHWYHELAMCYGKQGKYEQMEELFEKFLNVKEAPLKLANWYVEHGEFERAEKFLKKVQLIRPEYTYVYTKGLATLYGRWGKTELRDKYLDDANKLRMKQNITATEVNYRKFAQIAREAGVQLIVMQYPMRSVELLKNILRDFDDIMFVSNEDNFKRAIEEADYSEYFEDSFAGDFGHCTPKGNRIIAENVGNRILEFLNKEHLPNI